MNVCESCVEEFEPDSVFVEAEHADCRCDGCERVCDVQEVAPATLRSRMKVLYIPNHAKDLCHRDCDMGLIRGVCPGGTALWILFWRKNPDGKHVLHSTAQRCEIANLRFLAKHYAVSWPLTV